MFRDSFHSEVPSEKKRGEEFWVEGCGRAVPAKNTDEGIRAVTGDKAIEPASVQRYLETKFGDDLETVVAALQMLAKAYKPKELADEAYALYEKFRPAIPGGALVTINPTKNRLTLLPIRPE